MRQEMMTEEWGVPDLLFVTTDSYSSPIRLSIVKDQKRYIIDPTDAQWLHICAEALHRITLRPKT